MHAGAAALRVLIVFRQLHGVGREKLAHGEADIAEDPAGVFTPGAAGALFFRHAVVVHGHQKLTVPFQTDDGKLAEGHIDAAAIIAAGQLTVKEAVDKLRHLAKVAVAFPFGAAVGEVCIQHNGIDGFL